MIRVMIVIDSYRVSGPAKGVLEFCDSAIGHVDPLILVFQRGSPEATEFRRECERRGVLVQHLWERFRGDPSVLRQALGLARSFRPELIQTHGYKPNVVGLALRWRLGLPWIAFSHGRTRGSLKAWVYQTLDELLIRRADQIVAVSESQKNAIRGRFGVRSQVVAIRNSVGSPRVGRLDVLTVRREMGLHQGQPVVAVVGRLSPEKGQSYFVHAMVHVAHAIPGVQGLIVGDGHDEHRLRAKVAKLGLTESIHFAGYHRDMARIYAAIDLLVLPSLSEGLPNVVLEAMAHGRPVVASRVGGVPELIEDGISGVLVPPSDSPALARAIVTLLLDPGRRDVMGKAARDRIEREFSVQMRTKRILSTYAALLQRNGLPA